MPIDKEHTITAILAGGFTVFLTTLVNKFGEQGANKVADGITKPDHREAFVETIIMKLRERYKEILQERLKQAKKYGKEDFVVNRLGELIESAPGKEIFLLEQFALMNHITRPPGLSDQAWETQLRKEWRNPEESEFLLSLYNLDDDRARQLLIRTRETVAGVIKDASSYIQDPNTGSAEALKSANEKMKKWLEESRKKRGIKPTNWGI